MLGWKRYKYQVDLRIIDNNSRIQIFNNDLFFSKIGIHKCLINTKKCNRIRIYVLKHHTVLHSNHIKKKLQSKWKKTQFIHQYIFYIKYNYRLNYAHWY